MYVDNGKYAQAEALYRRVLGTAGRAFGPENPLTLHFVSEPVYMYQKRAKYGLAETYAARALEGRRHALGSEDADTMASASDLALAYLSQGKFTQSEALAREAMEFFHRKLPDDWRQFRAKSLLGASLAGQKKYAEAEPLLLEGYLGMLKRKDQMGDWDWPHIDRTRGWIVQLYHVWGQPAKTAEWRKK